MIQDYRFKKLIELAEASTEFVEANGLNYFWVCDDYKFNNIHLMRWYETAFGKWANAVDMQLPIIRETLQDKTIDMNKNYDLEYLKYLRSTFDHIQLLFSGGYDSVHILTESVSNGIEIDEVLMLAVGDLEDDANQELRYNAIPMVEKHKNKIGKITTVHVRHNLLAELFRDPYTFFTLSTANMMPIWPGRFWLGSHLYRKYDNGHVIRGAEKPLLLCYDKKWYAGGLDTLFGADIGIPNMVNFWNNGKNIKSLIQDARRLRDYYDCEGKIDCNKVFPIKHNHELNTQVLKRHSILNPDKQMNKNNARTGWDDKTVACLKDMVDRRSLHTLANYFTCLKTFHEVFPDTQLAEYNSRGKFAWLIDIDSLEVFKQDELLPAGAFNV